VFAEWPASQLGDGFGPRWPFSRDAGTAHRHRGTANRGSAAITKGMDAHGKIPTVVRANLD